MKKDIPALPIVACVPPRKSHRWSPLLGAVAARKAEADRINNAPKRLPSYGFARCVLANEREFKVGRVFPFEVTYIRTYDNPEITTTIIVEDPPGVSWQFNNSVLEFHKYFEVMDTL